MDPQVNIWLINGPPRTGKDTAGQLLAAMLGNAVVLKFATPLKLATHAAIAIFNNKKEVVPVEHYDLVKDDESLDDFFGVSPRECYIQMSESFCKPLFGKTFFGRLMIKQIEAARDKGYLNMIITDSGFIEEVEPLVTMYGADNIRVISLSRSGCSFDGDSRGYIDDDRFQRFSVVNVGTKADLRIELSHVLKDVEDGVEEIPF